MRTLLFWTISQDPVDLLPTDAFQAMVQHSGDDQLSPNTGVWLLRSCSRAKEFLREVWSSEKFIDHRLWENAAVLDLLGYDLWPFKPAREFSLARGYALASK